MPRAGHRPFPGCCISADGDGAGARSSTDCSVRRRAPLGRARCVTCGCAASWRTDGARGAASRSRVCVLARGRSAEAFGGWDAGITHVILRTPQDALRPAVDTAVALGAPPRGARTRAIRRATARCIGRCGGVRARMSSSIRRRIPSYAFVLRRISDIDLRFVHLVRDSRGVVYSWQKSVDGSTARGPGSDDQVPAPPRPVADTVLYNGSAGLCAPSGPVSLLPVRGSRRRFRGSELRRVLRFAGLQRRRLPR